MSVIESLEQAIMRRRHECSETVADAFRSSVRPIFASADGRRPVLIGSCLLMDIDNTKYVVTAAHIVDWTTNHAIYVGGTIGTQPVQIVGEIKSTQDPPGGQKHDKFDCAFWKATDQAVKDLGAVTFIDDSRCSKNQVSSANRFYLGMGYPLSRNKRKINNAEKTIKTALSRYTGTVENIPELVAKLKVSGNKHFFLKFEKYSATSSGKKVCTFKPKGMSGGALIDLGNFATVEKFIPESKYIGYLSGLLIEHHANHNALMAVRIEHIIKAIKSQSVL